jgi:hypothetical protein
VLPVSGLDDESTGSDATCTTPRTVHTHPDWSKLRKERQTDDVECACRFQGIALHSFHSRSPRRTVGKCWHQWHAIECGARARREFKIKRKKESSHEIKIFQMPQTWAQRSQATKDRKNANVVSFSYFKFAFYLIIS